MAPSDKRCDDVFNRGLSGELDRGAGETEPFGAQPHLRDRLFTRNIDRALLRLRQRRRHLDQQRRLADAGIAAEQQHRAAHEAAAGDAIEFGDAGGEAGRVLRLAGERLEREAPALARRTAGRGRALGAFLGDRVPLAAGVALALPAAGLGAAVLADEAIGATGHGALSSIRLDSDATYHVRLSCPACWCVGLTGRAGGPTVYAEVSS